MHGVADFICIIWSYRCANLPASIKETTSKAHGASRDVGLFFCINPQTFPVAEPRIRQFCRGKILQLAHKLKRRTACQSNSRRRISLVLLPKLTYVNFGSKLFAESVGRKISLEILTPGTLASAY